MTLTSCIPIRAYRKYDLRVKLMNPDIDLKDNIAVMEAVAMDNVKFRKLLKKKLSGVIPEEEWKHAHILSADVVKVIVSPDQPVNGKKVK